MTSQKADAARGQQQQSCEILLLDVPVLVHRGQGTRHDIMEDSRYLEWDDRTITLLWMKEELEEG
jgi:hypothetical protein